MKSIQYSIRSIPEPVDKILRKKADSTGKSFNSVVVEALEKVTGADGASSSYSDLDKFIGAGVHDENSFIQATDWLDSLPNELDESLC